MNTDYIITILVLTIIISYYYLKKQKDKKEEIKTITPDIKEELERRAKILNKVETFVKSSKFIEPIAVWKSNKIYKYIFNEGKLYEFEEIMPESKQKIGIDEEYLCFKRFCYKRVTNPINFINKFGKFLDIKEEEFNKNKDNDLMLN